MTTGDVEPGPGVCSGVSLDGMSLLCMPMQGGRECKEKKTRFGRRVVTNFTALYIIISHYKHDKLNSSFIIFNNIITL